jgi:hypothetical protein
MVDQVQYCCGRRDQYSIVVVNVNLRVAMDTRMDTRSPVKAQSSCAAWWSEPDLTLVPEWEKGQYWVKTFTKSGESGGKVVRTRNS